MFHSARLQLTIWYTISMVVLSLAFSVVVYQALGLEVERFDQLQRAQFEEKIQLQYFPNASHVRILSAGESTLVTETKSRILNTLLFINVLIVIGSTVLGYFLADRTLIPIRKMLEDQKRFISDASHELRTPLTSLRTSLEVFMRGKKPTLTEAQSVIKDSFSDVQHLQNLTTSLLQLSALEDTHSQLSFEPLALNRVIEAAIKKVSSVSKKNQVHLNSTLSHVSVPGNQKNLTEVFVILLDNAIKYSAQRTEVAISMTVQHSSVQVTIADQGIGIKPSEISHIFDRFYRADTSRSQSQKNGYGLGLSIANKIVAEHQGSISVASHPGKGSTFVVVLPLAS